MRQKSDSENLAVFPGEMAGVPRRVRVKYTAWMVRPQIFRRAFPAVAPSLDPWFELESNAGAFSMIESIVEIWDFAIHLIFEFVLQ